MHLLAFKNGIMDGTPNHIHGILIINNDYNDGSGHDAGSGNDVGSGHALTQQSYTNIRNYIINNPKKWKNDKFSS